MIGLAENSKQEEEPVLANKMLCLLLRSLVKNIKIPVAYYFVKSATSHDLLNYFQVVLTLVEDVGYKVVRVVTDGASINVSFFHSWQKVKSNHGK